MGDAVRRLDGQSLIALPFSGEPLSYQDLSLDPKTFSAHKMKAYLMGGKSPNNPLESIDRTFLLERREG